VRIVCGPDDFGWGLSCGGLAADHLRPVMRTGMPMANDLSRSQLAPRALFLDAVWRQLGSVRVVVLLLGLLTVALALTATIPQAPPEARADPQAFQRWLATSASLPDWAANLFSALGLFHIPHSLWFRFLLGLIALSLLIALVEGVDALRHPAASQLPVADAPEVALSLPAGRVRARLERLGFRGARLDLEEADVWYGRQARPGRWGAPLLHVGLLVALVGVWLLARWGWRGVPWIGLVGQSHPTGHGTPYQVRLDAFEVSWTPAGEMDSCVSQVTVLDGGTEVKRATLRVGRPLAAGRPWMLRGAQVRQVGVAPRVVLRARDAQGRTQLLESPSGGVGPTGEIALRFASGGSEHLVILPGRDELVRLVYETQPPSPQPIVRVEVQRTGDDSLVTVGRIGRGGQVNVGDLVLDLEIAWEPALRADHTPGAGLILGGLLLALVGAGAALAHMPRGVWLRAEGEQTVLLPSGPAWEVWWPALLGRLEAEGET
jgi:hypothetical protein